MMNRDEMIQAAGLSVVQQLEAKVDRLIGFKLDPDQSIQFTRELRTGEKIHIYVDYKMQGDQEIHDVMLSTAGYSLK